MSDKQKPDKSFRQIELAQYEVEQARKRFLNTVGALQYRLKPGTLVNNALSGVREKGEEFADGAFHRANGLADGAVQAVKERPVAASGVAAALVLFLARAPLWRAASRLFGGPEDEGVVKTRLHGPDANFDLTAPTVDKQVLDQGVSA